MEKSKDLQSNLKSQRGAFEDLIKRRFVYTQTAEIYGGVAGLYDYGPIGTAIKNNFISLWRLHFLVEDDINEITSPTLVPQPVFKASGHEDRFNDFMVKDEKTHEAFRVDKLIEDHIEKTLNSKKKLSPEQESRLNEVLSTIGNVQKGEEFDKLVEEFKITNPNAKKNKLSKAYEFNLMFSTQVGPMSNCKAYLRPETAQNIFTNFKRLLEFNNGKLPFGTSIIGNAYRNEIAPRNGLLRVREFEMAEIEYFVDPMNKSCSKFDDLRDLEVPLFDRKAQESVQPTEVLKLGDAVDKGIVANSYVGYFIGRTYLFAKYIGLNPEGLRFRQHLSGEMAHYACDCWDLEILTSYGWIECVGIADRSAYDLSAHMKSSGEKMNASRSLDCPYTEDYVKIELNKGLMGKAFKKDNSKVLKMIEDMNHDQQVDMKIAIDTKGEYNLTEEFKLTTEMFKQIDLAQKVIQEEKYIPNVIEPSFGIGRIVYALLEHSFSSRENDKKRTFFKFKPIMAPYKVVLLPLMNHVEMVDKVTEMEKQLRKKGIACKKDTGTSTIGKRYARTDEMGIPFGVTVDYQTLEDGTVTFRDSLSMTQVRMHSNDVVKVVTKFLEDHDYTFEDVAKEYPLFNS